MSLPTNNKKNGKSAKKLQNNGGSKFILKPTKNTSGTVKKTTRTGGTRGS